MPSGGGAYGHNEVADTLKRKAAKRVSHVNVDRRPSTIKGDGKFAHVKPLPKP